MGNEAGELKDDVCKPRNATWSNLSVENCRTYRLQMDLWYLYQRCGTNDDPAHSLDIAEAIVQRSFHHVGMLRMVGEVDVG